MLLTHQLDLFQSTNSVVDESIYFLKHNLPKNKEIFVGFSGGKDSIITAKLMKMSGLNYKLFYSFTGIEPPEVVQFIRKNYSECIFLKPKKTFWQNLLTNTPPSNRLRWCCYSLKKEPSFKQPHKYRVFGLRAEESNARAVRERLEILKGKKIDYTMLKPIFYWKEWQVWDFIESNNLKYPVLYDEGFHRIGCIICPFHTKKQHAIYRLRYPKYFECYENHIEKLFYKRKKQGKHMYYTNGKAFCEHWYQDKNAYWYDISKKEIENC